VTGSSEKPVQKVQLGDDALERIAVALTDLYYLLYEERPLDPRASLTGNMLAFVFEDGLSVADEWLLRTDRKDRLREFREQFLAVAGEQLIGVVSELTGLPVTYSFYGFDPETRTTHAIFVLNLTPLKGAEQRQAVLNWGEQVRRNARRLREEHVATRETQRELTDQMRAQRDAMRREAERDD
jgi:Na+-translocating membrane potential-generating system (MpsC)